MGASQSYAIIWLTTFITENLGNSFEFSDGVRLQSLGSTRPWSDEERLIDHLFDKYNPTARPVMSSHDSVLVNLQFSLMHIKELDVRSQVLTTTGLLILQWQDERLQWRHEDFGNLTELIVEANRLWRPEFAVINGAEKIYETYGNFRAIIKSDGYIRWEPGGVFKTMCQIDITYYPFDHQNCELKFGAWSYHTSKMNLTNTERFVNKDSYKTNGEWEIMGTCVAREEFAYTCCPQERFSNVGFTLRLRRRHTFYIMNVILPSILTSILLLSIFFCTPGQKVQIGVVVLLSFRIFLLNVADNIPKTSDHIPLLGIYLTCTMAITTLSMVLTVFILNLHHISDRPVPPWLRKLVLGYCARVVGMCHSSLRNKQRSTLATNNSAARTRGSGKSSIRKAQLLIRKGGNNKQNGNTILEFQNEHATEAAIESTPLNGSYSNAGDIELSVVKEDKESIESNAKDWTRVAEVFDRLFFWLFLLAILVSTLVLFHPLTDTNYGRNTDSYVT